MRKWGKPDRRLSPAELRIVKDRIARARVASARCRSHLEQVWDRSEPRDPRLREFLCGLVLEETRSESRLGTLDLGGMPGGATSDIGRLGEEWLDRDTALFLAEGAEKERTRTFSELARGLPGGAARALLQKEAARERPRLILLRNILLDERSGTRSEATLSRQLRIWLVDALARLVNQVREGRDCVLDLRSVYDSGVASGPKPDGPYALLLDVLGGSPEDGELPLSASLRRLADAETAEAGLRIARHLLANLMARP